MAKCVLAAPLLSLLLAAPLCPEVSARPWQTGRLVAVEINGQYSLSKSGRSRRDIWWTYTLSTRDRTYFAVSRESPSRIGVAVNSPVRLSAEKDRIYLLDPQGNQHILRIIRQDHEPSQPFALLPIADCGLNRNRDSLKSPICNPKSAIGKSHRQDAEDAKIPNNMQSRGCFYMFTVL